MLERRGICIVGTDTDAGKTVTTAALALAMERMGIPVLVLKPVQTGCMRDEDGGIFAPDVSVYRDACPDIRASGLVLLENACSPHLAAADAGVSIEAVQLSGDVRRLLEASPDDFVIIEGAGGIMTPLNERETMLDFFARVNMPMLITVPNRLGAINQALVTIDALRSRGIELFGFVLVETSVPPADSDCLEQRIRADNRETILAHGNLPCFGEVPFLPELSSGDREERSAAWTRAAGVFDNLAETLAGRMYRREEGKGNEDLLEFDRLHVWHPYTSAVSPLRVREAVSTRGCRIKLKSGRELVDGMSSWWCAVHGYNNPVLLQAVREQVLRMPHVMFGGLTHEPAVKLAEQLLEVAPQGMERVFFADSGSVAVEVAIKMALQFQLEAGHSGKSALMTVRGGYHGDTMGAMSVCDPVTGMHGMFAGVLPEQIFAPRPDCRFDAEYDPEPARLFEETLAANAERVAAVILEPIVQGAGGMWFYHPQFLRRVSQLCREYGCLFILDEIATGFGRSGKMFASEWAAVHPDIMCVGKALTGGMMTLSATLATRQVAEGISRNDGVLMHGPTFMANPTACAVASASIRLLEETDWPEQVARIETGLKAGLEECRGLPGVADVRVLGAIGVVEMERPVDMEKIQTSFVEKHGVWIRPFGKLIYVMPPYVISGDELNRLTVAISSVIGDDEWE